MKKKIYIFLIIVIIIFLLICFIMRLTLNSYINNNIKYEDINKITSINLSISSEDEESNVVYKIQKSNSVYKINYDQYENDKHNISIEKYYIENNGIYEYTYNNGNWDKNEVSEIDKIFNIDYKRLKKSLISISYKGIEDKKYKKYTAKIRAYDAYNFIYSKDILTNKDNNNFVDINIYIDKSNNMVYKIECIIPNITSVENNTKSDYKFEITNTNINNNDTITIPFKK